MKQCPVCKQTFTDDNSFCLMDGSMLNASSDSLEKKVYSGDTPTVVNSKYLASAPIPVAKQTSLPKWLYSLLGLLVGLVIVFGFLAFNTQKENKADKKQLEEPESVNPVQQKSEVAERRSTTEISQKPKSVRTSRIKFVKGAVSSTISERINNNESRIFLLKARGGQRLSADVKSNNNCVIFENNSSSMFYTTIKGDNQVKIKNNCEATGFNLTVSIL